MNDDIDAYVGRRMRRRRRLLRLTQQQLAESCGVRFQQIQKYECAANHMSASRLWRIAQVLGVPISYFFEGFEPSERAAPRPEPPAPRPAVSVREPASFVRELESTAV
jgi:transcriptional regulator with XRE-family HTH domain